jgi:hypothetical protein
VPAYILLLCKDCICTLLMITRVFQALFNSHVFLYQNTRVMFSRQNIKWKSGIVTQIDATACLCVYVCVCTCVYIRMVCSHTRSNTFCGYVFLSFFTCEPTRVEIHVYVILGPTPIFEHVHAYIHKYIHIWIHILIYKDIHMCIHGSDG